jgi:hypothetical protein
MRLAGDIVLLADKLVVVQHVEFLASAQLLATHHARKAVQVKHFVSSLAHKVAGRDALRAAAALGAVPPATDTILQFFQHGQRQQERIEILGIFQY